MLLSLFWWWWWLLFLWLLTTFGQLEVPLPVDLA